MLRKLTTKRAGFTLVEIMIVVAIIALLAAIAVPGFLRARKRSQASKVLNDLRLISSAMDQYAIETNKKSADPINVEDWTKYQERHPPGGAGHRHLRYPYGPQTVDSLPQLAQSTYEALSDVAPDPSGRPTIKTTRLPN